MLYSNTALLALGSLTLQLSVLSAVLFLSRSTAVKYNPSSAVIVTELLKMSIAVLLIFLSGELDDLASGFKKVRRASELLSEEEDEDAKELATELGHDEEKEAFMMTALPAASAGPTPASLFRSRSNSIPSTPQLAVSYLVRLTTLTDRDYWVALFTMVRRGAATVAIPAILFAFQSIAQYTVSENLTVPVSQLMYQLKIPATALFSILLLNRKLMIHQWLSLFMLTFGVWILLIATDDTEEDAIKDTVKRNTLLGIAAVLSICMSSGYASTYFERLLRIDSGTTPVAPGSPNPTILPHASPKPKDSAIAEAPIAAPSIWVRNVQLSLFGLATSFPVMMYELNQTLANDYYGYAGYSSLGGADELISVAVIGFKASGEEFFKGFNYMTVCVIALQVTSGLSGAVVISLADNIAKGFAVSCSIVMSIFISIMFFDFKLSLSVIFGAVCVLGATALFARPRFPRF